MINRAAAAGKGGNERKKSQNPLQSAGGCGIILKSAKWMVLCPAGACGAAAVRVMNVYQLGRRKSDMDLVKALTSQYMKEELPEVTVGNTVRVHVKIKEGARERVQVFEGTVIAKQHGGIEESFTVRRISYGVGC